MTSDHKLFTAQMQRLRTGAQRNGAIAPGPGEVSNREVLQAINGLRDDIRAMANILRPEEPPPSEKPEEIASLERERAEVGLLRTELRALANSIQQTKVEIAALRPKDKNEDDRLVAVTFELDAIVTATEGATQGILDAAERIDHLAASVRSHAKDSFVQGLVDEMREQIITIFEACNFQDITGQRITKVVNTLKYVEERINAMIDIWGADSFHDLPAKSESPDQDEDWEKQLLNGPQLDNQGISQDEIDKLFG